MGFKGLSAIPWKLMILATAVGTLLGGTGCSPQALNGGIGQMGTLGQANRGDGSLNALIAPKANVAYRTTDGTASCGDSTTYSCSSSTFSPTAVDGISSSTECASFPSGAAGAQLCLSVSDHSFNTLAASKMPGIDSQELDPGATLNYKQYGCVQSLTGATGSGMSLASALQSTFQNCSPASTTSVTASIGSSQ